MTDLGRIAYEAYAGYTEWKSLKTGDPLPAWDELSIEIRDAWNVSAHAVAMIVSD